MITNKSEKRVVEEFESKGYRTLRNGAPDFVFFKEDRRRGKFKEVIFVEVKKYPDKLKENQKIYGRILKQLGAKYKVVEIKDLRKGTHIESKSMRQKEILETLIKLEKTKQKISTSKLCSVAGINYNTFLEESKDLVKNKLVREMKETLATYWEITEKGKKQINKLEGKKR